MEKKYKTDDEYLIEILEHEEERLFEKLGETLSDETRCLFYKYISVTNIIKKLRRKTA